MGGQLIDIVLFAVVVLFLGYRLWSVLGRRTGTERPPVVPPSLRDAGVTGKVVPMPRRSLRAEPAPPPADPLKAGLQAIAAADPSFQPETFLPGARRAFEIIVRAFAEGDTATLRPLLSDEVYDAFAEVIRHRLTARETVETRIARLDDPVPVEARLEGRTASVTLKLVSAQVTVTHGADGAILEGDPDHAAERTDLWTFARNVRAADPNWMLVATGAPQ
jgi:predicted lipid-binding transport protein (Tim44 family)